MRDMTWGYIASVKGDLVEIVLIRYGLIIIRVFIPHEKRHTFAAIIDYGFGVLYVLGNQVYP